MKMSRRIKVIKKIKQEDRLKISMLIPVTSNKRDYKSPEDTDLFKILMPSFQSTYDRSGKYEYNFYIGYDDVDSFYCRHSEELVKKFKENWKFKIRTVKITGLRSRLSEIWTRLAEVAYPDTDYYYQLGDDIRMLDSGWSKDFVERLRSSDNFGVTGPVDLTNVNNPRPYILTQSFVHRSHFDLFGYYFPSKIKNWFIDDWITYVYPSYHRSEKRVINIGGIPRYEGVWDEENYEIVLSETKKITEKYLQGSKFHSQEGQDKYLEENIFKGHKNGFFVDVGAHDGIDINNTLYFETKHQWKGINIEPIKKIYDKLVVNRENCINLNIAVSDTNGKEKFINNEGYTEMISGLQKCYDKRHLDRLQKELKEKGGESNIIEVETKRLDTIFDQYKIKNINYLSIDVEGAEFNVLKSINFDNVFIDVIGFENNYKDTSDLIIEYLESKGYKFLARGLDIFMIHKNSRFLK